MSKDKIIGLVILVGAAALLVFYTLWLVGGWIQENINPAGPFAWLLFLPGIPGLSWTLAVVAPLWLVAVLVLAIAMWIGYSMLDLGILYQIHENYPTTSAVGRARGGTRSRRGRREEEG